MGTRPAMGRPLPSIGSVTTTRSPKRLYTSTKPPMDGMPPSALIAAIFGTSSSKALDQLRPKARGRMDAFKTPQRDGEEHHRQIGVVTKCFGVAIDVVARCPGKRWAGRRVGRGQRPARSVAWTASIFSSRLLKLAWWMKVGAAPRLHLPPTVTNWTYSSNRGRGLGHE